MCALRTTTGVLANWQKFLKACPSNAFQKVPAASSTSYTLAQRFGAIVRPMPQLFVIGFGACKHSFTTLQCTILHYTTPHCTTLYYTTLYYTTLYYNTLHCTTLHCTALHCTTVYFSVLHYIIMKALLLHIAML